ncbi:hypothetical protein [Oceanisphaera avium]|uniref:Uncharacterized protein n=1 Tax=Oceanisphaera avium TaxID=1903694 RepID=A0A1Y0CZN9_9GAMM|nr:hypothetical protein [Oceanisphaera avium]ART80758.1 hypothetical protein CBP12_11830 [Oceanisphaera avium]
MLNNSVILSIINQSWRWSVFLMFPLLLVAYVELTGVSFAQLDEGTNQHKWVIMLGYLLYVLVWLKLNRHVKAHLEQRSR